MIAQVTIEFDTGSEYGGKWTFEEAYNDAKRAAESKCREISAEVRGVKVLNIISIRSHVQELK
jgi:hypothetical protein